MEETRKEPGSFQGRNLRFGVIMKGRRKRTAAAAVAVAVLFCAAGCSGLMKKKYTYSEAEDTVFVSADGSITDSIVSDFDKDYYSVEELTGIAMKQVLTFNQKNYNFAYYSYDQLTKEQKQSLLLPVSFESIKKADGKVTIVFSYANGDTYTRFNSNDIAALGGSNVYTATVSKAVSDQKITPDMTFMTADGTRNVKGSEIAENENYIVFYADYPVNVYGEHEVAYISPNAAVIADNGAKIGTYDGSFIIFK